MTRWIYTGDFSWSSLVTIDLSSATQNTQIGPNIMFDNSEVVQSNMWPNAIDTYLVLRNLEISSRQRPLQRTPRFTWYPAQALTFSALASTTNGTAILKFNMGGISHPQYVPSGLANTLFHLGCWLRRIYVGSPPAGVTISDISVAIKYSGTNQYDDLNMNGNVTGWVDLANWYDNQYGVVCYYPDGGGDPEIDVQFTYTNTNLTNTNVPITLYGGAIAFDWVQFNIIYADWAGVQYAVGKYDNLVEPVQHYVLDRKLPTPVPGGQLLTNTAGYGNLVFTILKNTNFYNTTADLDITLTAYLAVLLPN